MENDMSKTHEYFQQQLGLDSKTSEAITILMDEGLLEPLLIELRDAQEAEDYQNSNNEIDNNLDPTVEITKDKINPMEASLMEEGLSLEEAREWGSVI